MNKDFASDVLVVGAGPVGLTLAMDLARSGVRVTVVEVRRFGEPPNVKCNHVSARSMEQFRRLGVSSVLRQAGLPEDFPNDVVFRTRMTGEELTRIPIPCRRDRYTELEGPDTGWPTPEPPHRINQIYLEPLLLAHAVKQEGLSLLSRTRMVDFEQDDHGVLVSLEDLDTQEVRQLRVLYLVGCDGGSSGVRKKMGAQLQGTEVIQRVQSTHIRAPQLAALLPGKLAWCYYSVNPDRCGTVFAIDGQETWLVHNHLNAQELEFDSVDRDKSIRHILGVGPDFEYQIITKEDWVGRRLVANRFRNGKVFLAGDAAHLWVPYAGYGMNAGIADATNLAWLLSARVKGWADESILDAYEAERQPITEQVSHFVMNHAQKMIKARSAVPAEIEADNEAGQAARLHMGQEAYALNVQQFCCAGLNFGYFYEKSPIIAFDEESAPAYTMGDFTASTVPGCRAPHFWLNDGRSLYDELGPAYTLMVLDASAQVMPLLEAAQQAQVPLKVLVLSEQSEVPSAYTHKLLICRTDQHVVWRGDDCTVGAVELMQKLRGLGEKTDA
ncbi:FAD-dependent oxidoreductase [Limnohabitans sp. WS1]|uniref:FAD-dependent oxidoreductase n=1 Tax=Limnohabitans sp. WS1 TaxID=1100726 RepID=UPI000D3D30DA|nr:FAD-dependent oxidoreductase [Limnohabitans sp. WS1]PUE06552.1 monooxygenase [Limnohabitans sp. WS1]